MISWDDSGMRALIQFQGIQRPARLILGWRPSLSAHIADIHDHADVFSPTPGHKAVLRAKTFSWILNSAPGSVSET